MLRTEVLIVGGGPAGSACAWQLKQHGVEFILLDRAEFPRPKVCAGWVTPRVLRDIQLDPAAYPGNFSVFNQFLIELKGLRFTLQTRQYAIRRVEFDQWLINRVRAQVITHQVKEIRQEGEYYLVDEEYRARYLIGAGGTNCPVKRALFEPEGQPVRGSLIVAQEEEFVYPGASRLCHLWFLQQGLPGYAWYFPKSENVVNVGVGGSAARLKERGDTLRHHWELLTERLYAYGLVRDHPFNPLGHSYYLRAAQPLLRKGNALLIGDALGVSTLDMGEGIGPSIQSGINAAMAIINHTPYTLDGISRYSFPSLLRLQR
ncbi:MAG TPA: NAD(P)/FAD-dependent oxidoreductase [Anaerolineaceae bacterium]|nr:NAD(P)/FAD-dependent oxidoreductase [Anaerolineaceae bacterium]HQF69501.1 NAD(P)/FAD-dependent oxidoreductase [Anaerolineaceae bacterium]